MRCIRCRLVEHLRGSMLLVNVFLLYLAPWAAQATPREVACPSAATIPQLTIEDDRDPKVSLYDKWQVFLGDIELSDMQVASWAGREDAINKANAELKERPLWVFLGLSTTAVGTAISSAGWALFGRDKISDSLSLTMALGGLVIGTAGLLLTTEAIQNPLEPHLAPTPRHRLSRQEMQELVALINRNLYRDICLATQTANSK
jgi:hypothetical protein